MGGVAAVEGGAIILGPVTDLDRNTRTCNSRAHMPRRRINKEGSCSTSVETKLQKDMNVSRVNKSTEAPQRTLQGLCKWSSSQFGRTSSLGSDSARLTIGVKLGHWQASISLL